MIADTVVGDAQQSDAFLWDLRQSISGLLAENHRGTIAGIVGERGMTYNAGELEDHLPQAMTLKSGRTEATFDGDGQSRSALTLVAPARWSGPGAGRREQDVKYSWGNGDVPAHVHRRCRTARNGSTGDPGPDVRDLAEVLLNGTDVSSVWTRPFRVDMTDAARSGANALEINPGTPKFEADAGVLPAGIRGPVRLITYPR